ncbi:hypothetical protein CCP3SC15_850004 [Gammaproteobacteria bacterium]
MGREIINYGWDQKTISTAFEKSKQVTTQKAKMGSLTVIHKGTVDCWLKIQDTADGGTDSGPVVYWLPLSAGSFVSIASAGMRFGKGIFVSGVTAAGGATPISFDDLWFVCEYMN